MAKILIVEDEAIVAKSIQNRLEMLGYDVPGIVDAGEKVLKAVKEKKPDLVLMDIRLKGRMDGIEAAQQLRRRYSFPIIFLTAYCDDETLNRAKQVEPDGYIVKPFAYADLKTAIEMALHKYKARKKRKLSPKGVMETIVHIRDAIVISNEEGHVILINPVAEALIGCREGEVIGITVETLLRFYDKKTRRLIENPVLEAMRTRQILSYHDQLTLVSRTGKEYDVVVFVFLMYDKNHHITGGACVIRDILGPKGDDMDHEDFKRMTGQIEE